VVVALAACAKPAAPTMNFERPPAPVQVAVAEGRNVAVYIDAIGRAVAKETVWVKAQVEGRVDETRFEDGADLKKGDVLFVLDARPFQARLASAEASVLRSRAALARAHTAEMRPKASLERAKAARDLARAEFSRVEGLVATKAVSQADFDNKKSTLDMMEAEVGQAEADVKQAEPEVAAAEADVKKAESDVATARLDVEYCTIRSPIDGRAGHRLVDAGNLIASMSTSLVLIERLDPVYVDFTVPENDVTAVQRNMAKGALRVEARLPDVGADETRTGELTFLDNNIAEGSGTLALRATLPNADHHFWPGRFVKVRLVLEPLPQAVLVPAGAPQLSGKGTFIYVVKDDGTAEMRFVELGQRQGELIVVKSGVKAGERVVVVGQLAVTPGGKVRVEETAQPAAPAAAPATEPKK
jgi:multidrug efflux system membrane fusion protein